MGLSWESSCATDPWKYCNPNVDGNKVKSKININNLHRILGHCGEAATRMTGKSYGYDVVGDYKTCEDLLGCKGNAEKYQQ
jgi:hypothetical protein